MTPKFEYFDYVYSPLLGLNNFPYPELGSTLAEMQTYYEQCQAVEKNHAAQQVAEAMARRREAQSVMIEV